MSTKRQFIVERCAVVACLAAILVLAAPEAGRALFIDSGTNTGFVQQGEDGLSDGDMGEAGAGGAGGKGGIFKEIDGRDYFYLPTRGEDGDPGGVGGAGGDGGNGTWILRDMGPGDAFTNSGQVILGGRQGNKGARGSQGGQGGQGGDGAHPVVCWFCSGHPGTGPIPDLPGIQGGDGGRAGLLFAEKGQDGVDGGGGGGGAHNFGMDILHRDGGNGGKGIVGWGGTGAPGISGSNETHSTSNVFANFGTIQIGGQGADGGRGGEGGWGGGGGGGIGFGPQPRFPTSSSVYSYLGQPGGMGGPGGEGGDGGAGGHGTLLLEYNGRLINEAAGTIRVGRGSSGGSGSLQVQYGGELVNHGSIILDKGELLLGHGSFLMNSGTGSIDAAGQDLLIQASSASIVNDGEIIAASLVNDGHISGSGRIVGDFTNLSLFAPGSSPGGMTIEGNYEEWWILSIVLGGTDGSIPEYSYVDVLGDVTLQGLSVLELEFFGDFDESDLTKGDFFDVIRYTGALSGEFNGIDDANALLTAGLWSIDYGFDLGNGLESVRLQYIPEPSTAVLLAAGLAGMAAARRRRSLH